MKTIVEKIAELRDSSYYWIKVRLPNGSISKWIQIMFIAGQFVDWSGITYDHRILFDISEEVISPDQTFTFLRNFTSWL